MSLENVAFDLFTMTNVILRRAFNKDGTISIHHRNIQTLATEMFKVKNEICPGNICDIFTQRINNYYNLRHINHFETHFVRTICNAIVSHILHLRFGTLFQENTSH